MALTGLSSTTAEFMASIRFNAREGVFSRADRVLGTDGNFTTVLAPINEALAQEGILIDVANIEIGWIRFEGQVDIVTQHHSLGLPGPQPTSLHKEGIRLEVWLPKAVAEGAQLREWTNTARGVINAINDLHTAWEGGAQGPIAARGEGDEEVIIKERIEGALVPHVTVGTEEVRTKNGTFHKPTLSIIGWVPRPVEWPVPAIVPAATAPTATFAAAPPVPETAGDADLPF